MQSFSDDFNEPVPWQNNRANILGVSITALSLSGLCIAARLYTRLRVVRAPGWDDLCVSLCFLTSALTCTAICIAPQFGLGQHFALLSDDDTEKSLMLLYISNAAYISSTTLIKLSLLLQYLRLYEKGSAIRLSCSILALVVSLSGVTFSFMAWVPCFPVEAYWDLRPDAKCYGFGLSFERSTFVAHTSLNMVFDIFVLAFPVPLYFDKSLPAKARFGLLALLLLGCLVNFVAGWRLGTLVHSLNAPLEILDVTWYAPTTMLLSITEVTLASVCASIPIFWPVLTHSLGAIFVTKEVEVTSDSRSRWSGHTSEVDLALRPLSSSRTSGTEAWAAGPQGSVKLGLSAGTETRVEATACA